MPDKVSFLGNATLLCLSLMAYMPIPENCQYLGIDVGVTRRAALYDDQPVA